MCLPTATSGKTSVKKPFKCIMCLTTFASEELYFSAGKCSHPACLECMREYFQKLLQNSTFNVSNLIQCPGFSCRQVFANTEDVTYEIFNQEEDRTWWDTAIILTFVEHEIQCPRDDCTGRFDSNLADTAHCTFTECCECRKGFCIACVLPWNKDHEETGKYSQERKKRLNDQNAWEERNETLDLAEEKNWSRCPKCAHIVLIADGCNNIICRCGTRFCYHCGRLSSLCNGSRCYDMDQYALNRIRKTMFDY